MLRNYFLGGTSQLALLAPDDEGKTAAEKEAEAKQKERDSIKVEKVSSEDNEEIEDKEGDDKVAAKEEEIEEKEEKVEELEKELEDKTLTPKEREKLEGRIEKERKKAKDLRDENTRLKAALEAKTGDDNVLPIEEIDKRANEKAVQLVAEKEFERAVSRVAEACKKVDKKFSEKLNEMAEDVGSPIPGQMINILDELPDNGGNVLMYLAENQDEFEEIYQLPPAKMAVKLTRIADKLAAIVKPPTKQVSKVPPVKEQVGGSGDSPDVLNPKNMDEFARIRARQVEERRKARMH